MDRGLKYGWLPITFSRSSTYIFKALEDLVKHVHKSDIFLSIRFAVLNHLISESWILLLVSLVNEVKERNSVYVKQKISISYVQLAICMGISLDMIALHSWIFLPTASQLLKQVQIEQKGAMVITK